MLRPSYAFKLAIFLFFQIDLSIAAQSVRMCPDLTDVNKRVQARVTYLLQEVDKAKPAASVAKQQSFTAADSSTPNLYVALADIVATRAKEEARVWLVDKVSHEICDQTKENSAFFPNICEAVKNSGEYPGASFAMIKTHLREDIYALPACFQYPRRGAPTTSASIFTTSGPADTEIDPYVLEAALIAVHLLSQQGAVQPPEAPSIFPLPDKTQLAKIVAAAAIRRFSGAQLSYISKQVGCQPTHDELADLLEALATKLKSSSAVDRTVETILVTLRDTIKPWCTPASDALEAVGDVYVPAVRGDYYEAAFAASHRFLCNQNPETEKQDAKNAKHICSRIPLLAEVASAKNQDDMEAALDRMISPLGSWRRKQAEQVWSLNAMAGFAFGKEQLKAQGSSGAHSTYGLYVPIALEYSHPLPKSWFRSIALGLTMLDLGSIVSYSDKEEIQGGDTSSAANAKWSSLTSPGVYVALAIKDSPFRVGVSYSKTPSLRSINFGSDIEMNADSTRYMLFVTADVALLTF